MEASKMMRIFIFFFALLTLTPLILNDVYAGIDQHYLKVRSQPDILFIPGSGFYNEGKVVKLEKAPQTWQGYSFMGWKVDGKWADGNPISITMDRSHEVEAIYEKGIGSVGITIDSIPRVAEINVDGELFFADELPLTFDWEPGSSHLVTIKDIIEEDSNTRYKFDSWKDSDISIQREILVEEEPEDSKYIILYKKQHYLKSITPYGSITGSGWHDEGTSVEFSVDSEFVVDKKNENIRYLFDSWNKGDYPNLQQNVIDLNSPETVKAEWIPQYKLDVGSNVPEYQPGGSGWFIEGKKAMLVAEENIESEETDTKYEFNRWVSKGPNPLVIPNSQSPVTSINVDKPYVIQAEYKKSYLVSVFTPFGNAQGGGYYKQGDVAEISMKNTEVVIDPKQVRKVFKGWDTHGAKTVDFAEGDPDLEGSSVGQNLLVFVNGPVSVTADWKSQYYLDVDDGDGKTNGEGWYDIGKMATISVRQPPETTDFWTSMVFDKWTGDIESNEERTKVMMSEPKVVIADWKEDYSVGYVNGMILAGLGGIGVFVATKARKKKLVSKLQENDWKRRNYETPFERYQSTRAYEITGIQPSKKKKILSWLMGKSNS